MVSTGECYAIPPVALQFFFGFLHQRTPTYSGSPEEERGERKLASRHIVERGVAYASLEA